MHCCSSHARVLDRRPDNNGETLHTHRDGHAQDAPLILTTDVTQDASMNVSTASTQAARKAMLAEHTTLCSCCRVISLQLAACSRAMVLCTKGCSQQHTHHTHSHTCNLPLLHLNCCHQHDHTELTRAPPKIAICRSLVMAAQSRLAQAQSCPVRALRSRRRHTAALPVLLVHLCQRQHMLDCMPRHIECRASHAEQTLADPALCAPCASQGSADHPQQSCVPTTHKRCERCREVNGGLELLRLRLRGFAAFGISGWRRRQRGEESWRYPMSEASCSHQTGLQDF